jgi:hypothetical protein
VYFFYVTPPSIAHPVDGSNEGDDSGHLGQYHNQGGPLYFDTGHHQNGYDDYPAGYDGYGTYAPHHDHEHYVSASFLIS